MDTELRNARIDQIIASIKGEIELTKNVGFNMRDFFGNTYSKDDDKSGRNCGTIACIAGHAHLLADGTDYLQSPNTSWMVAKEFLDLTGTKANDLFYGHCRNGNVDLNEVKPEHAIEVLEELKKTGDVNWSVVTGYDDIKFDDSEHAEDDEE